jgi:hypothetical protein
VSSSLASGVRRRLAGRQRWTSGRLVRALLHQLGATLIDRAVVDDDPVRERQLAAHALNRARTEGVLAQHLAGLVKRPRAKHVHLRVGDQRDAMQREDTMLAPSRTYGTNSSSESTTATGNEMNPNDTVTPCSPSIPARLTARRAGRRPWRDGATYRSSLSTGAEGHARDLCARHLLDLGGTPEANNAAHASDWPAAIRFITTN